MIRWLGIGWGLLLAGMLSGLAQTRPFVLGTETVQLERAEPQASAYFRAFRPNRTTGRWEVDVIVTNGSGQTLRSPLVLRFEVARQIAPGIPGSRLDGAGQPFLNLTPLLLDGALSPGETLRTFTLSLGDGVTRPELVPALYSLPTERPARLAVIRTLTPDGLPREGVVAEEIGPAAPRRFASGRGGWLTLAATNGVQGWRFQGQGFVPAVRLASELGSALVTELASVRLPATNAEPVSPWPADALPLPSGWSPVWLRRGTAGAVVPPLAPLGRTAVVARWDDSALGWRAVRTVPADNTQPIGLEFASAGFLAVLVADQAPITPASPADGELLGSVLAVVDPDSLRATGRVNPATASASREASRVTATATIEITSVAGPLSSGLRIPVQITEEYRLRDGSRRLLPGYTANLVAFQSPTNAVSGAVLAEFPLRPFQLLAGEELSEAVVRVEVLAPSAFAGAVLNPAGGALADGSLRITAGSGDLARPEAAVLKSFPVTDTTGLVPPGLGVTQAFELSLAEVTPGRALAVEFGPLPANRSFVLARTVFDEGRHGFQPVQRFQSDAAGKLVSAEPTTGERLSGVDGGGQFWLFQTAAPEALVTGIGRNSVGNPVAGLLARRGPWTAFTDVGGKFRLLAPAGRSEVSVLDAQSGDTGLSEVEIGGALAAVTADLDATPRGPRVVAVSPANLATGVPRVTPVVVTFNRPLNPVTVVAGGVRLLTAANAPVEASLSLNLAGTAVTLLPTSPLSPGATYRLEVAPTVTDLTARLVEGDRTFQFATEVELSARTEVPLVIHEPLNGEAALVGGPGLAEPESPVILVNETTGFTATVLSKVDGSFSNSLPADVDDLLSAVIVNRNGTRNTVPASRQLFRDGRVGLYQAGGVLTAALDGVSVAVTVPPGSVPNKTIFRLRPVSVADLAAATAGAPPAGAIPLRGFQLETTGDPLREPLRVSQPVNPAEIAVPPGATPEQMAFALVRGVQVDGVTAYEVVDTARFVDGRLETEGKLGGVREGLGAGESASAPNARSAQRAGIRRHSFDLLFHFLFMAMSNVLKAQQSLVIGEVYSVETANGETVAGSRQPVAGAAVRVGGEVVNGAVSPGSLVAISAADGSFVLPGDDGLVAQNIVVGSATSQLFPGQIAVTRTTYLPDLQQLPLDLFFRRGGGALIADDRARPTISVSHAPASPQTNLIATLRVLANDDKQMASVNVVTVSVTATDPDIAVSAADVTVTLDPDGTQSLQTIRRTYGVQSAKPLTANLLITAEDAAGRTNAVPYALTFGGPPPPPVLDPNDVTGPFVTRSTPTQGTEGVLPGQVVRVQFSEPIKPDFLNNPGAAFQLSPSAGNPVAVLRDNDTAVELTWYRLAPGTAYHLTVVPILYDRNGNRFDQNPYNNSPSTTGLSADAFGLSFTTAPLTPTTLPGVANGVGVAALGRQLLVLDRESASSGAIQIFDATDPARPSFVSRIALPAFPRAFTVIPQYSFKRTVSGPVQTSDLVVAAGGTLGGEGQWLRVFALLPNGTFQRLVTTTLSSSPAAAVGKFQWSAPLLGYLENDADTTMVGLLNLQLAILADNQTVAERAANPAGGKPGKDINGDGDYVDAGEELPLPDGTLPRLGVINGGLVAGHVAPDPVFRLRDFDIKFGGNFLGAIMSAPPSDGRSRYTTFVAGGVPVTAPAATLELTPEAKRLFLLFGQEMETTGGVISANLALVSQHAGNGTPPRVLVLDVTDPASPQVVSEIRIPAAHGIPQTILQRDDGLLALATSTDQLLLDPRKLRLVPLSLSDPHPALVGLVAGTGSGLSQFVNSSMGFFAVAAGGRSIVTGLAGKVNLTLHTPGSLSRPGQVVAESLEADPSNVIVSVNEDNDDAIVSEERALPQSHFDNADSSAGVLDNDLVRIDLRQLPPSLGGAYDGSVELEIVSPGSTNPAVRVFNFIGSPLPGLAADAAGTLRVVTDFTAGTGPLTDLSQRDMSLFFEGLRPCGDVAVRLTYRRRDGAVIGMDDVHFIVARLKIAEVWSNQFEGGRVNRLPGFAGMYPAPKGAEKPNNYLLMANRADGQTHVKARIEVQPNLPAVRRRVRLTLLPVASPSQADAFVRSHGTSVQEPFNPPAVTSDSEFRLVAPAVSARLFFVAAGFSYFPGQELPVEDIVTVFGERAYLAGPELIYSRGDEYVRSADPHLEIVNQTDYNIAFAQWQAIAAGTVGLSSGRAVSPLFLATFVSGGPLVAPTGGPLNPLTIPLPADAENPGTVFEPNSSEHNVGFDYDTNGVPRVATFRIPASHGLQNVFLSNSRFLKQLAEDIRPRKEEVRQAFLSSPGQVGSLKFHWPACCTMDFAAGGGLCDIPDPADEGYDSLLNALVSGLATCPEFDLKIGIGGCGYQADLEVEVEADPAPFTVASRLVVKSVFVRGFVGDRYDWKYEAGLDHPLAILQAGYGTLGTFGRVFEYKAMIEREVEDLSRLEGIFD